MAVAVAVAVAAAAVGPTQIGGSAIIPPEGPDASQIASTSISVVSTGTGTGTRTSVGSVVTMSASYLGGLSSPSAVGTGAGAGTGSGVGVGSATGSQSGSGETTSLEGGAVGLGRIVGGVSARATRMWMWMTSFGVAVLMTMT